MTDQQQHPIIVPGKELKKLWREQAPLVNREEWLIDRAAQWGADQELEACCEWLLGSAPWTVGPGERIEWVETLAMCRRPKPPSLKEQALAELTAWTEMRNGPGESLLCDGLSVATIRRALEALPND